MGPLTGLRVVEFAGIGPGPMAGMMLADMGADVVLIERPSADSHPAAPTLLNLGRHAVTNRGKRSIVLDLKQPDAVATALALIARADALIEGFRPGVMERLGLGPAACHARNPKLVYGRMTGWGQSGPLAHAAGHDLNYVALAGGLDLGRHGGTGRPWIPPTLVGDMGGGAMLLAFGLVCGVLEARNSGRGQIVDAAISDGAALLASLICGAKAAGVWSGAGGNLLDGSAPFYDVYRCADDCWIAFAALEPQFHAQLIARLGLDSEDPASQHDVQHWPDLRARIAERIAQKTRAQWCELFEGTDACFAPVLDLDEAPRHAHNRARGSFVEIDGIVQPAPAPRFDRTPGRVGAPPPRPGEHTADILRDWGATTPTAPDPSAP